MSRRFGVPSITHRIPEYAIWQGMKDRCLNPRQRQYHDYGGRGIKVCARWEKSFEAFLEDMGRRPSDSHMLDRKDNDGDYEPGNCRWVTRQQQNTNKRNNVTVEVHGVKVRVAEECWKRGIDLKLAYRKLKSGVKPENLFA